MVDIYYLFILIYPTFQPLLTMPVHLTGQSSKKAQLAFGGSSLLSITRTIRTKNAINALICMSTLVGCQAYSTAQIVQPLRGCTKALFIGSKMAGMSLAKWSRTYNSFVKVVRVL